MAEPKTSRPDLVEPVRLNQRPPNDLDSLDIRDSALQPGVDQGHFYPKDWPPSRKWVHICFISFMTFLVSLSSTIIAPTGPSIAQSFHTSDATLSTFVTTIFLLGYAFGPFILSPLSEIYGRLPVYHTCNILFLVFTVLCAVSRSLGMLIAFRFLAGASSSFSWTVVPAIIGDLFVQDQRGLPLSIWASGLTVSPVLGPIIGGFMTERVGWRWELWTMCIASGLTMATQIFILYETYPPGLLRRKTAHLRHLTNNPSLLTADQASTNAVQTLRIALIRPILIARQPIVFLLSLYNALLYGLLYLFLTHIPVVFQATYGWSLEISGLAYLGLGIGLGADLIAYGALSDRILQRQARTRSGGKLRPEDRLVPMIAAGLLVPMGLVICGWSIRYHVFWLVPEVGMVVVGIGMLPVFATIPAYLIDAFPLHAASANTMLTLFRSLVGTFLPLAGPVLYRNLGEGWGNTLLAICALVFVPAPWVFWKYGEGIREAGRWSEG